MIYLRSALRLYLVADPDHCDGDLPTTVETAIEGGVTMVQLRAKRLSDRECFALALELKRVCVRRSVPFLVNDRVDIAQAVDADGVHLGVDDLPVEAARSLGGPGFIIGFSPETDKQLEEAKARGVDYLGIGPVFSTATKPDAGDALGLDRFADLVKMGRLPTVGIGGIDSGNVMSVLKTGADGVAVVSAILKAADPREAAHQISRNS